MDVNNHIRWLHLSDLHIGNPNSKWFDSTLRTRLGNLKNRIGEIDFILITGDMIHQGNYKNSDWARQAKSLLSSLKNISDHIIFCLGNHDYERNNSRINMLADWEKLSNEEKRKEEDAYSRKLRSDFESFVSFFKNIGGIVSTGSYVCDQVSGINIVVLNTSTFSGQPVLDEAGDMVFAKNQVKIRDAGKLWMNEGDFPDICNLNFDLPTIVTGHHNIQMFESVSQNKIVEFIKNLSAKYYFCGHIHRAEDVDVGGITQCAASGLFSGNHNIPIITVYQMQRNANEHIESHPYEFREADWSDRRAPMVQRAQAKEHLSKESEVSGGSLSIQNTKDIFESKISIAQPGSSSFEKIPWDEYYSCVNRLIDRLKQSENLGGFDVDIFVGISRGGLAVADLISRAYGQNMPVLSLYAYRDGGKTFFDSSHGLINNEHVIKELENESIKRILILDSFTRSGTSIFSAKKFLKSRLKNKNIKSAVIYADRRLKEMKKMNQLDYIGEYKDLKNKRLSLT